MGPPVSGGERAAALAFSLYCDRCQALATAGLFRCQHLFNRMPHVDLDTVYRTSDEPHFPLLSRIREKRPSRDMLMEVFQDARMHAEVEEGYLCVPNSKSELRILAQPGVLIG